MFKNVVVKSYYMFEELRAALKRKVDVVYRDGSINFFKEKVRPYGVRSVFVKKLAREYFPKNLDKDCLIVLCEKLFASGWFEEANIAIIWAKRGKVKSLAVFERWLDKYVSNWAHDDGLCCQLIGPLLEENPELVSKVKVWTGSKNRWKRRAAAVSFVVPGGHGKFLRDIFDVAEKLLTDEDDLVQKGYGWMLKVASKKHRKEVFDFVIKHKKSMPRTALRYAIEIMPEVLRKKAMA